MAKYITRVELNGNPTAKDYEKLHAAMEAKGFSRTIRADNGVSYKLPHAMYYGESSLTTVQVQGHASAAAKTVWTKYAVFTCEAPNSSWEGMDPA